MFRCGIVSGTRNQNLMKGECLCISSGLVDISQGETGDMTNDPLVPNSESESATCISDGRM